MSGFNVVSSYRNTDDGSISVQYTGSEPTQTEVDDYTLKQYGMRGTFVLLEAGWLRVIPRGFLEVSEANVVMRGHMLAGRGDFSGSFAAGNVNAVNGINIKGGAVGAVVFAEAGFIYKKSGLGKVQVFNEWRFNLLPFTAPVVLFRFCIKSIKRASLYGGMPSVRLYKNNVLIDKTKTEFNDVGVIFEGDVVTMMDINPSTDQNTEYKVVLYEDGDTAWLVPWIDTAGARPKCVMTVFYK